MFSLNIKKYKKRATSAKRRSHSWVRLAHLTQPIKKKH